MYDTSSDPSPTGERPTSLCPLPDTNQTTVVLANQPEQHSQHRCRQPASNGMFDRNMLCSKATAPAASPCPPAAPGRPTHEPVFAHTAAVSAGRPVQQPRCLAPPPLVQSHHSGRGNLNHVFSHPHSPSLQHTHIHTHIYTHMHTHSRKSCSPPLTCQIAETEESQNKPLFKRTTSAMARPRPASRCVLAPVPTDSTGFF